MRTLRVLFLATIFCKQAFTQSTKVYQSYKFERDFFTTDFLTLSTDNYFFFSRSCECGIESYSKGTWKIKDKKLYLYSFDSTRVFPKSKIDIIKSDSSDSVLISTLNYFKEPISHITIALIRNDTTKFESVYSVADSLGKLKVSKQDYMGFYLIYESFPRVNHIKIGEPFRYHYYFDKFTKQININIDFANAGFDRQPAAINYGNRIFTIKENKLIDKKGGSIFLKE